MSKNTSVQLGDYFVDLVKTQVNSGKYASVSEVIKAGLELFEHLEQRKKELVRALEIGEQSGMNHEFNSEQFTKMLHTKYLNDAV